MNITCDWMNKLFLSPDQSYGSACHSTISNGSPLCVFCVCFHMHLYMCVHVFPLPPSYLFFLVWGKQMKNLGRKVVSVCSLKRTISARGKCCSSCAAERVRRRADGTYSLGVKGVQWGQRGHPSLSNPPAHSFTVT